MWGRGVGRRDLFDEFVHGAVRAYATATTCPPPPADAGWAYRAADAGVLAPVCHALSSAGHDLPSDVGGLRLAVAMRHLRTLRDLAVVAELLDGADIRWVVVKGPVLATEVFAHSQVRDYADLDLLVDPEDVGAAVRLLVANGATLNPIDWDVVVGARTAELSLTLTGGTALDLHWSLLNLGAVRDGYHLVTADLLDRRVVRDLAGVSAATLDDLDLVLHVMLHACLSGCSTLRWLLDVQQCLRWLEAEPPALADRARERGVSLAARAVIDSVTLHLDPTQQSWADAFDGSAWTTGLRVVSKRRPPSSPSLTTRSSKTFYAATRSTTSRSARALATTAGLTLRYARSGWPEPRPAPGSVGDPGFSRWLDVAGR